VALSGVPASLKGHIQRCPRIQDRGRCRDPGHRSHLVDSRPRM